MGCSTRPAAGPRTPSGSGSGRGWTPRSGRPGSAQPTCPNAWPTASSSRRCSIRSSPAASRPSATSATRRRGDLKLSDVGSAGEFLRGDRLLRSDHELARALDGVHHRGEVYLRWLQRFSALAFGTPVGRFLTLFLALPFGGSYVLLKGLEEIHELAIARFTHDHLDLVNGPSILLLGTLALGMINFARFRRGFLGVLGTFGRTIRAVVVDLPARLLHHPLLLRLAASMPAKVAWWFAIKPGLVAAPIWLLARAERYGLSTAAAVGGASFLAAFLMFNTRAGRRFEEWVTEAIGRAGRGLIFAVIPGLFHLIMWVFDRLIEWVEKVIYAVDEWLRFREGQSPVVLAVKAVLGLFWGVVAYAARIYLVLLVEPQLNPIKHFPVVTVAAKIMLPFVEQLQHLFAAPLKPILGTWIANAFAAPTVFFLPGLFGFLVWELRRTGGCMRRTVPRRSARWRWGATARRSSGSSGRRSTRARCPSGSPSCGGR